MPQALELDTERLSRARDIFAAIYPICAEVQRRKTHPCFTYKPDDSPDRNQLSLHKSEAPILMVFGGSQSGKSCSAAHETKMWLRGKHPYKQTPTPCRIYVISASYRTLQEGIYRHLKTCLPEWEVETYGRAIPGWDLPGFIRMKNGSQIDFISGEGREDARRKIQAAEIDLAVIDEEVDELLWEELMARRLARGGRVMVAATLLRSEPWCLQLEDRAEAGDPDVFLVRLSTYAAARAGHVKNKVVKEMESTLPKEEIDVRLHGRSRRYEGLVYPEFGKANVIPVKPGETFEVPKGWTRYMAIDPGWRTWAVLWAAVGPDEKYIVYRELYLHSKQWQEVASAIFAAMQYRWIEKDNKDGGLWVWDDARSEHMEVQWIDPAEFGHNTTGEPKVGHLFAQYGLACAPARNDVHHGVLLCRQDLAPCADGVPRMRVLSTCTNFLKEIRSYRHQKETRDENKDARPGRPTKQRDHLMDTWRYLVAGGLEYRRALEPWQIEEHRADRENYPHFQVAKGAAGLFERDLRRAMAKNRKEGACPAHPGGIGSIY